MKCNAIWFVAAFVYYTHVYLVFVASLLLGRAGFLPVFAEKFLQRKAGAQFVASYLLVRTLQSPAELAILETMRS